MMPTPDSYQLTLLITKTRRISFRRGRDYLFFAAGAAFGELARSELPLLDGNTMVSAIVLPLNKPDSPRIARPGGGYFDDPLLSFRHPTLPSLINIELSETSSGGGQQPRPQMQRVLR
jgi:hypothetical protein